MTVGSDKEVSIWDKVTGPCQQNACVQDNNICLGAVHVGLFNAKE